MTQSLVVHVACAVEGLLDEAVLRRLIGLEGGTLWPVHGKQGKHYLRSRIGGYNNAARNSAWVVLVDLNHEFECAPLLLHDWLPSPARLMSFRIAVREVESWLLGDRERMAAFLAVPRSRIPERPDLIDDPKAEIVRLARNSRKRDIREGAVPGPGSGRSVGTDYTSLMLDFVRGAWRPDQAALQSPSLAACVESIRQLVLSSK